MVEQALETAGLMLGTDKSRGYCLEMICADFLAGANLENGNPQILFNQGDIRAQNALSDAYLNGRGIPRDYVRAYTWAAIAAGLPGKGSGRLSLIGSRMTAVQIVDAHRRISIWWERYRRRADVPASSQRTAMPHVSDK